MPSFLALTPEPTPTPTPAPAPTSAPHYPLPSLFKHNTRQPTTTLSAPGPSMLTLLIPAPPDIATDTTRQKTYLDDLLTNIQNVNLEAFNIILGQTAHPYHDFPSNSYVTAIQILAEPVCGLDLPTYSEEWKAQVMKKVEPVVALAWEMHDRGFGLPDISSILTSMSSSVLNGSARGQTHRIKLDRNMDSHSRLQITRLEGEVKGWECVREMSSWRNRTEVAVIEDVPFLIMRDGVEMVGFTELGTAVEIYTDEQVRCDMRGVKAGVREFRDRCETRWAGVKGMLRG
ncbi:hypothetical protein BDV06DRAFT_224340 [Aspergillus oleicola]